MEDKYRKYHGDLPGVFGGLGFSDGPKTDEEIESILEFSRKARETEERILKESYGINFVNVGKLESREIDWFWCQYPYVCYDGVDPNNEKLRMVQTVTVEYIEGDFVNYTEDETFYYGITSWYDENGFEVKREVRKVRDQIDKLNVEEPPLYTITREKGLIIIRRKDNRKDKLPYDEDIYYDTGTVDLPDYDREYGNEPVYPIATGIVRMEDHKGQVLTLPRTIKEKAILACRFSYIADIAEKTQLSEKEIIAKFNELTEDLRRTNDPKIIEYLDNKLRELKLAIAIQKETIPLKEEVRKSIIKQRETERENKEQKEELNKALEFIKGIKRNILGKMFFKDKIDKVDGIQKKNT